MQMINDKDCAFRFGDFGPKYIFRGPKHEWGLIRLKPGDELGAHYHNEVEETFYFLSGKGKIKIMDKEFLIHIGDAFRIEPKEHHNIICQEEMKIIFIKCPYLPDDKIPL
ncbi:MAG: cupin domain-containing protein [Candidatus Omnitrophica bacterium]|nr:cupin domain-containing protein [Candidatus Omnitrophota bacterium]